MKIVKNYVRFQIWIDLLTTIFLIWFDVESLCQLVFLLRVSAVIDKIQRFDEHLQLSYKFPQIAVGVR